MLTKRQAAYLTPILRQEVLRTLLMLKDDKERDAHQIVINANESHIKTLREVIKAIETE